MGGGKGGSSSQTVSIPPEFVARYNDVNARAEKAAQTPFTPYSTDPEAFVEQLSGSQKAGIANINAQQGAANEAVNAGQDLQGQGIDTAQRAQAESLGIDRAALQGISQAQQQGTAYNQAAGKNIGQAMSSAAPYMQGMAGLTQAGLGQGQQYLGGATGLTQQAIQTGQQYAGQAQPYYTGALQAAQPLNQQAQQYMQAGTQAVNPEALNYSQYMNPYMKDVVQAQQALQSQENAAQRSAMQGKAIQAGAFGGDRAGIEQANLARQQSLANQATMANLLQSGYGQAQQMAAQQQGVGLGAAQANRAAQQQAAQQAAALGQQQYGQTMGVGTGLAALGQQQYGQALGTGAQIGQLGQQGYTQNLGAGAQLGQVGQNLYNQNIGQGQAIQGLGQQQYAQGLGGAQAAAGIGQNMYGMGAQTAGLQQAGGMNIANLGMQNQAAQIAAAQAQMAAGQQQQQTAQAGKTALYNQFLQQQGYPFQIAQLLANIATGTGAVSGSTTTATRTGQRGGRMGDGYASGGLVPPDSQGGAVYEPGLYGRGGYADGGAPDYSSLVDKAYSGIGRGADSSAAANDSEKQYWVNKLKSGEIAPDQFQNTFSDAVKANIAQDPNSAAAKAAIASGAATAPTTTAATTAATTPATTSATTTSSQGLGAAAAPDYASMVDKAYSGIGRGAGSSAAANDSEKQYWINKLKSGEIAPDQFQNTFSNAVTANVNQDPNSAAAKAAIASGAASTPKMNVQDADKIIKSAYSGVGRSGIGANAENIDQAGYDYWLKKLQSGDLTADNFNAQFNKEAQNIGYNSIKNVNADISSAFKDSTGKDIDATSAKKYQDMLDAGMSIDQIKYSIEHSQPALLKQGDVGALKGQSLAFDPSKFTKPAGVTTNQNGAFSAEDFTPANTTPNRPRTFGIPQNYGGYGNMSAMQGGYGGYGGGYGQQPGYGQPSNYGMPNFGSSPQYGGAPDYAGAGMYGAQQYNMSQYGGGYGMPNFGQSQYGQQGGYGQQQYGQFQQQQAPQATGKGAAPSQQAQYYNAPGSGGSGINPDLTGYQQQAPQATGKGSQPAQQPPQATGKGMSTGGRAGYADGGRIGYLGGGPIPGDPYGVLQAQQASFAGAPGAGVSYVPAVQAGGQRQMLQPQKSILPEQKSGIKEAIGMGTSIASLGEAGNKLYDKLSGPKTTGAQDAQKAFDKMGAAKQSVLDEAGGLSAPKSGFKLFGENNATPDLGGLNPDAGSSLAFLPDLTGGSADWSSLFGGFAANGGRIGYAYGGIPGLEDLKQGHAGIPGDEGLETPFSHVVAEGTQTPAELKAQMNSMSSGAGGGGGSGGGLGSAIGTAASLASLGSMAFKVGGWMMGLPIFASGGRVGKAGGGALVDPSNPQDQKMAEAFDNLLQRYDNNPLLAAAAMDVGTKVVDEAIQKAQQTGGDITDFLPRRTQEYMFALSKAAMGAHDAMSREARAAGGRTGYAFGSDVDEKPTGLAPAPSDAMTMGDVAGGLSPEPTVQVADLKNPDILRALRGVEGANDNPEAKNPNSTAGGLYQYVDKTWQTQAPLAGVDIKQYPTARSAPAEIQHQVADANVSRILEQNKGNVQAVPHMWYAGNVEGKLSPEGLAANKGFTQEQYNQRFFNKFGAGAPEEKPTQVATATGLAPKTDAGPFERTIGKILPDAVPTESSFWVPLIAGLGTMLASDKYRFSQRLGEGLVGGAAAYGKSQEFQQKVAENAALMGLKGQEFGLQQQKFTMEQRNQAIQIMMQLQKINLGRQMAGQPELSADDYFKQVGASDLLPAAKAPAAASTAAPAVTPPAPAGGLKPPASVAPTTGGAEAGAPAAGLKPPAVTPAAGASATPQSIAAAAPGMPSARDPFWATVDRPYSLPVMEQNWNLAMSMGDTVTANAIMQRMGRIEKSGEVMVGGKVTHIPGYLDAQAAAAAAKETATKQAGLPFIERIGPGGEKYIPALADQAKGTTPNIPPASTEAGKVEPTGVAHQKAVIDQKTGQVNGSIPAPPPGGGYPLSKQPGATGLTQAAQRLVKNDEQFEKDFMEKTPTMDAAIERLDQMANSFKMIHSGAMEDKLKGYAALAASYGDQKLAARIMGGQIGAVAAAQLIDKNKVNLVLDTLKAANPRFAQSEFLKLSDVGSPDIAIDPAANHGMISANKGMMEWSRQFTRDWEKAKEAGWQSPSVFFSEWSQLNPLSTFQESARRRMGTFGGMELPPANEWIEGAVYHVPKGLKGPQAEQMGRAGLKGGDTFRFSGNVIERVKPSELFKYGQ